MTSILILSENLELKADIWKYLIDENYTLAEAQTPDPKEEILPQTNVIIFDASSFQHDVPSFINQLKIHSSLILVIVVVKEGDVETAVQAMRAGAVNALALPIDKDRLCKAIEDGIMHQGAYQRDQIIVQQAIDLLQSLHNRDISLEAALPKNESGQIPNIFGRDKILQIGDLSIHIREEKAFYRKKFIDLTPSQFKLLAYLAEANGRVIPFDELYFHLHSIRLDLAPARKALSAHMSYLRNKLTAVGCAEYLVNVRGRGYIIENAEERNIHNSTWI